MGCNHWSTMSEEKKRAAINKGVETKRRKKEQLLAEEKAVREKALYIQFKIDMLEEKLGKLERADLFGKALARLTDKTLLTEEKIIEASQPYDSMSGIYFLIRGGRVIYIGQSTSVFARINTHNSTKEFDSIAWLPCNKDMLDKIESLYIHFIQPPENGRLNDGRLSAPLSLVEILG